MKKLLLLACVPMIAYAFPQPNGGVQISSMSSLSIPESLKNQEMVRMNLTKKNGYFMTDTDRPKYIMDMPNHARMEIDAFSSSKDYMDSHFKRDLKHIKLAFSAPSAKDMTPIGYAAIGSYTPDGWTGIKIVFNNIELGTCAIEVNDMALTGGSIIFAAERTGFAVNGKPTTQSVEGNEKSGFVYSLSWADYIYSYDMDCATSKYVKSEMGNMIKLAKQIDR
jgi:hypothetical protein